MVYDVSDKGEVTRVQEVSQMGTWPRHLALRDSILLTSDQRGDTIQVMHVEQETGLLLPGKMSQTKEAPAFIYFLE